MVVIDSERKWLRRGMWFCLLATLTNVVGSVLNVIRHDYPRLLSSIPFAIAAFSLMITCWKASRR